MNPHVFAAAIASVLLSAQAAAVGPGCEGPGLSQERIIEIARAEVERRGQNLDPAKWRSTITEDKCDYMVLAEAIPAGPGTHFSIRIKRNGKVDYYMGGA
jgi:hypothetical protein